jgi:ubiquinone/menaquinone biosynthesis C-methylase UbiE
VGERETVDRILEEIRRLVGEPADRWTAVPRREVSEGYPEWAPSYDLPGRNPILHLEGPFTATLFSRIEPGRALDAACGTGRQSAVLAGLGNDVVGVDATEAMLERARARVPAADFLHGMLTELPVETGSFDLAVCSLALTHLADPAPAIRELARAVRPGGRIVISDLHPTFVALGAQAAYRVDDVRAGYVVNEVHWPSRYLGVFREAGLHIEGCHELLYRREEVELWAGRTTLELDMVAEALVGLPAVIVWELARP